MLAKLAVARKQLGLDEESYRAVLRRVTGGDSARTASDASLHRMLGECARLGFKPSRPQHGARRATQANIRLIMALWTALRPHLTDGSEAALRSFVRRQTRTKLTPDGVDAAEFLTATQANRVIEGLKAWQARVAAAAEEF